MKTLLFTSLTVLIFSTNLVFSQKKAPQKNPYEIIEFDCDTNLPKYKGQEFSNKGKTYFLVKYKSQPVIEITNLPPNYSKIIIKDEYFNVSYSIEKDSLKSLAVANELDPNKFTQLLGVVDSDEVSYAITVKDSVGKTLDSTTVFAKVYGKFRIDLSTGVLFHNLLDESYYYSDSQNDQFSVSEDSSNGRVKPLFPVVLTHFYYQSRAFINPAISLGLGIDDSGKAGYYLGPSVIIGDRQRAVFTTGLALRPTDVLKGKYTVGQMFNEANRPDLEDLVESMYKPGIFFSITYNLTYSVGKR